MLVSCSLCCTYEYIPDVVYTVWIIVTLPLPLLRIQSLLNNADFLEIGENLLWNAYYPAFTIVPEHSWYYITSTVETASLYNLTISQSYDTLFIQNCVFTYTDTIVFMLCGSLSPRHGESSVCGWRRRPPHASVYPKFPDWPPGARTANGTALCH